MHPKYFPCHWCDETSSGPWCVFCGHRVAVRREDCDCEHCQDGNPPDRDPPEVGTAPTWWTREELKP